MRRKLDSPRNQRLRELLTNARIDAGLTQGGLASRLTMAQSFVSRYETGERRLDVVELMWVCDKLAVDVHQLIESVRSIAWRASSEIQPVSRVQHARKTVAKSDGRHGPRSRETLKRLKGRKRRR